MVRVVNSIVGGLFGIAVGGAVGFGVVTLLQLFDLAGWGFALDRVWFARVCIISAAGCGIVGAFIGAVIKTSEEDLNMEKVEKNWLDKVQNVLNECPTERLGFFTIGDSVVYVYDLSKNEEIQQFMDKHPNTEFCTAVDKLNAGLGYIDFPSDVLSTAG